MFANLFRKVTGGRSQPPVDAAAALAAPWVATHRHKKGGLYRVVAACVLEADRSDAVIYDDAEGTIWVRAAAEFWDGRFTPIS